MNSVNWFRKAVFLGLGIISVAKETTERLVNELVAKGELTEDEAKKFLDELLQKGEEYRQELKGLIRQEVDKLRSELGLVTRSEVDEIKERLAALESRIGND